MKVSKKNFGKALSLSLAMFVCACVIFVVFEPEIMRATSCPGGICTSVVTATVTKEVTISSPGDTSFSGTIPGVSGNPGAPVTASLTWTVITNDSSGFDLKLHASAAPALVHSTNGAYSFSDYTTTPSFGWTGPGSGSAYFGFSISAASAGDTATAFKDGGASCGAGGNTGGCWSGFNNTSDITVIHRTTLTDINGQAEIVNFKAESNGKILQEGSYTATITATASLN